MGWFGLMTVRRHREVVAEEFQKHARWAADILVEERKKASHLRASRAKSNANLRRGSVPKKEAYPEGLYDKDGSPHFDCGACGNSTPWEGETVDFRLGDYTNLCGGSPRCCP